MLSFPRRCRCKNGPGIIWTSGWISRSRFRRAPRCRAWVRRFYSWSWCQWTPGRNACWSLLTGIWIIRSCYRLTIRRCRLGLTARGWSWHASRSRRWGNIRRRLTRGIIVVCRSRCWFTGRNRMGRMRTRLTGVRIARSRCGLTIRRRRTRSINWGRTRLASIRVCRSRCWFTGRNRMRTRLTCVRIARSRRGLTIRRRRTRSVNRGRTRLASISVRRSRCWFTGRIRMRTRFNGVRIYRCQGRCYNFRRRTRRGNRRRTRLPNTGIRRSWLGGSWFTLPPSFQPVEAVSHFQDTEPEEEDIARPQVDLDWARQKHRRCVATPLGTSSTVLGLSPAWCRTEGSRRPDLPPSKNPGSGGQ